MIPPRPAVTYKYVCDSGGEVLGIRELGGAVSLYKSHQVLYGNLHGQDLSFFFTTHEPVEGDRVLEAISTVVNPNLTDRVEWQLLLSANFDTGELRVVEEKYVRLSSQDPWMLESSQSILSANSCKSN